MTGVGSDPNDRASSGPGEAELMESAGMQNSVAVTGPAALLLVPAAWALVKLKAILVKPRG